MNMNKTETLTLVELECKGLISSIELYKSGVERYEDVLGRLFVVNDVFKKILKEYKNA